MHHNTAVYTSANPIGSEKLKTVTVKATTALMVKYVKCIHFFILIVELGCRESLLMPYTQQSKGLYKCI